MVSERNWDADWAMCEAATPGPWISCKMIHGPHLVEQKETSQGICVMCLGKNAKPYPDAHFIAEARSALPYWLQRVKVLEAKNEKLRTAMGVARNYLRQMAKRYRTDLSAGTWGWRTIAQELDEAADKLEQIYAEACPVVEEEIA